MPTKTKEYSLYAPGALVKTISNIYSSTPIDGLAQGNQIAAGTVGVIVSGPQPELGFKNHYQVNFLNNIIWWVGSHEIQPYNY
jgi:hypothetical protein